MIDQTKNMMIGLFVIAACAIVTFIILFLHPSVGDEGRVLHVRFTNIDKINIGTRVTFAGKPVGEVVEITEIPAAVNERRPHDGVIYIYELKLAVDSGVNVFNTDLIASHTSGLLGEKSVEITPRPVRPGEKLRNVNDEIIYAEYSPSVEETLQDLVQVARKFDAVLQGLGGALKEIGEQRMLAKITTTFDHVNVLLSRVNNKWDTIDSTLDNLAITMANFNALSTQITQGESTLGKLLFSDDMYLRTSSIMSKAETIMDDVNHYGLLFHLDKGWQRMRARRMNLLCKLCTPQEFRNFFNDEVNQISTSLSRVSVVLDKTSCYPCYNDDFNKVFAELMRRVEALDDSLKLYNQQLVDCEVQKTEF